MGLAGSRYRLKVTAGPEYDPRTHQTVPVNQDETLRLENAHAIVSLCVRVQNYTGISIPPCPYSYDEYLLIVYIMMTRLPIHLPPNPPLLLPPPPHPRPVFHRHLPRPQAPHLRRRPHLRQRLRAAHPRPPPAGVQHRPAPRQVDARPRLRRRRLRRQTLPVQPRPGELEPVPDRESDPGDG